MRKLIITVLVLGALMGLWHLTHRPDTGTTHASSPAAASPSTAGRQLPTASPEEDVPQDTLEEDEEQGHGHSDSDLPPSAPPATPTPMPEWITAQPSKAPGTPQTHQVTPGEQLPRGAQSWAAPNLSNATAVAGAFLQRFHTRDAITDSSAWVGPARAAQFAADGYATSLRRSTDVDDQSWQYLQSHQGWTDVALEETAVADSPADSATMAYRAFEVTITVHSDDGGETVSTATQLVKLERAGDAWRVSNSQLLE